MIAYCRSDCYLLRHVCQRFRVIFRANTNVDPFESITLASAVNRTFRTQFLSEKSIGLIPDGGYQRLGRQSVECRSWIQFMREKGLTIIPEFRVGRYYADGYNPETNTLYEFCGDIVHGRPTPERLPESPHPMYPNCTNAFMFQKLQDKIRYFKARGYNVVQQWSSDFIETSKCPPRSPLDPRGALYGGRVSVLKPCVSVHKTIKFTLKISVLYILLL